MNLPVQIELMTVPQEFARFCNAILTAEHGDDYLPIDDDRPDRGNDGYLKPEKRLFAAHCFKRAQNQSIDANIRGKMTSDLGKAIALKREGIWDIAAWTFLCNYRVSENIASRIITIGSENVIDVSWRGPDELAILLQKHKHLIEQFPGLHRQEIAVQLDAIRGALAPLNSPLEQSDVAPPLKRSPRNEQEQHQLLATGQPGWEYLLFGGILAQGLQRLTPKELDYELKLARGPRQHLDTEETRKCLSGAFDDLIAVWEPINRLLSPSVMEQIFGAPEEPADPTRIEHLGQWLIDMYEKILDWSQAWRNLDVPTPFKRAVELTANAADQPINEIRAFINKAVKETDMLPTMMAMPESTPIMIELTLILTADDRIMDELGRELKRVTG